MQRRHGKLLTAAHRRDRSYSLRLYLQTHNAGVNPDTGKAFLYITASDVIEDWLSREYELGRRAGRKEAGR